MPCIAARFVLPGALNSAVPIGILRSAIVSTGAEPKEKVSSIFGRPAVKNAALLELLAEAALAVEHLHLGIKAALAALWTYAERGETPPVGLRATVIGSPFRAVEVASDLISRLYTRSSRSGFFAGHPLERAMRDIHAVDYGLETLQPLHHDSGRVPIGLDPQSPGF